MIGYVIADEHKTMFVCKGLSNKYSLTSNGDEAIIWNSKIEAEAVFRSNLSKEIKGKGVSVRTVQMQMQREKPQNIQESEFGSSQYLISVLADAAAKLNCRNFALNSALSTYDRQVTDVEHYIEFNAGKLNAYEGYQAYKLLQDVLLERRKVKNELDMINVVLSRINPSDDIANVNERVMELENRTYTPREFKHLFSKKGE